MGKPEDWQRLTTTGVVAVVRSPSGDQLAEAAEALLAGGIDVIEITLTVPRALEVLERVADRLGDRVLLGAGTVLDAETARAAQLAGARFLVAPTLAADVVAVAQRYGLLVLPGAFTPTEVLAAWQMGADAVKLFPADVGGPGYLKSLAGPLPQIPLLPTGGITAENTADFLRAGAVAVGAGSSLVEPRAVAEQNWPRIEDLARRFVAAVREARGDNVPRS